ncbi:Serine acetyltransferase [gamma proteobacterium IMCC1989]|nr:Serine acetyltransferase [gamma proteobacterium IMCC1989]
MTDYLREIDTNNLWPVILQEAKYVADEFPLLAEFYRRNILQHDNYDAALAYVLAEKLSDSVEQISDWQYFLLDVMSNNPAIGQAAMQDLLCQLQGNASIKDNYTPLLYFGGYQALQCYRFAHDCWNTNKRPVANYIQGRMVTLFGVDIHPAAVIGTGIFMDHAVGIVIGETAVIEDEVTLFQSVTLGGAGKGVGDRHPKVRKGAFIGSGAVIFGNIEIGEYAKVAGGAVVVKPVAANTTVVGPIAQAIAPRK